MKEKYIAAIDLGTSNIDLTIAQVTGNDITVIYHDSRKSNGMKYGAVYVPMKVTRIVKSMIEKAEKELQLYISFVVTNLPKCIIRQEIQQESSERTDPDSGITKDELESLKHIAETNFKLNDTKTEKLYVAIPQSYSDDENFQLSEEDIVGVISESYTGNFKMFVGKKSSVDNISRSFNPLEIGTCFYFTPATIAKAVLTEEEIEGGVAIIDFGGGSTSLSIYSKKVLKYYSAIPFGGKTITNDIKTECSISARLAENIKLAYGACMPDRLQTLQEKIIQIDDIDINRCKQIPVKFLSEIIHARVNELVQAMLYEIEQSGYADKLRNGLVITGGGANLANLQTFLREVSGYSVRLGIPKYTVSVLDDNQIDIYNSSMSNSIGMILKAKNCSWMNCATAIKTEKNENGAENKTEPEQAANPDTTPIENEKTEIEKINDAGVARNANETSDTYKREGSYEEPETENPEEREKRTEEEKTKQREKNKLGIFGTFKKLTNSISGKFSDVKDKMYDEMGDDSE